MAIRSRQNHRLTCIVRLGSDEGTPDVMIRADATDSTDLGVTNRILVVDDEPEIAESLVDYLTKKTDYTISVVGDGREAVRFLESAVASQTEIDLVLLDMRMPGMSGLEVLSWIREHPQLQYIRVVLLTAAAGSHEKVEALSAGADDYITKPYYPQELLARVQTILRTHQLEKQLHRQGQQLAALNRVGQRVAATLETREVLATAVAGVDEVLGVEVSAVSMVENGRLRYQYLWGEEGVLRLEAYPPASVSKGIIGLAFREQTPFFLNQPQADARFCAEVDAVFYNDIQSIIVAPLVVRGRSVGVLSALNKRNGHFTEVDLDLFASLASSISEAIENAWLFQRNRMRQQELLESRNTLQALIDGIPHPIYTINQEWQLVAINKSKIDELGQPEATLEGLAGQLCYRAFYDREEPCEHCAVAGTMADHEARSWSVRWIGPDHLPREWDVNAYPIPSTQAGSARVVIVWEDRTEERRLENSLLQAGKLAAIGQLAAGVAHEINNPLTAVNANAQMLKMIIPPDDEKYESVDLIARAGERAARVVRGLLDFARQEQYMFTAANVNDTIRQAMTLVQYQLQASNIEVVEQMAGDLPQVIASWEHLKSVWLNLLINARDALRTLPEPRLIEVTTQLSEDGQHVLVLVHDNGKGMSEAEAAHVFEPFYTTKDPGEGTGLGLATSHRIIEQHGGDINLVTAPNEGTTFIVRLPISRPEEHAARNHE